MSDTIPDVTVEASSYSDINTLSGIIVGTALVITNKSTSQVAIQISSTQPAADSLDGEILYPGPSDTSIKLITAGESKIWGRSLGHTPANLSVQDNT